MTDKAIVFCEECSQKNQVAPDQCEDEKVRFVCLSCGFHNAITLSDKKRDGSDSIRSFVRKLASTRHVVGAFAFHLQKGIIESSMPDPLNSSDLAALGELLSRNILACSAYFPDLEQMMIGIPQRHILVKFIQTELLIICISRTQTAMEKLAAVIDDLLPADPGCFEENRP